MLANVNLANSLSLRKHRHHVIPTVSYYWYKINILDPTKFGEL